MKKTEKKEKIDKIADREVVNMFDEVKKIENDDFSDVKYKNIYCLPVRGLVPFPYITIPLPIGRESSKMLVHEAIAKKGYILLLPQKEAEVESPSREDLLSIGVLAKPLKIVDFQTDEITLFLQTGPKAMLDLVLSEKPFFKVDATKLEDYLPKDSDGLHLLAALHLLDEKFDKFVQSLDEENGPNPMVFALKQYDNPIQRFNFISMNAPIPFEEKYQALVCDNLQERIITITRCLDRSVQLFDIKQEMQNLTREEITRQQKEHFLQSQIKVIKNELGGPSEDDDYLELQERAQKMNWSFEAEEFFMKELQKLSRFNPSSPDYSIQYAYLDNLLSLPWNTVSTSIFTLDKLAKDLDKDHFGLEKVKERIIEHMAVLQLRGDMRSPILCLYGPPGVGKTSLCKSIADSLDRDYARVSLGGLHDESEIRGHRKTYIGAMPGRIISALMKCKTNNPVFVLDEVDKIGKDYKGDPAQALLEVLDPEQNSKFHDNYLDVDYDLSKVLFIATANTISTISAPLLDRMELIDVSGYIIEEKIQIAKKHLIPKLLEDHGFKKNEIKFDEASLRFMIEGYTRESGVRKLEKVISRVLRKIAVKKASFLPYPKRITKKIASELLGKEEVYPEVYEGKMIPGVATGLAWTASGGEILYIESSFSVGKGNLSLTGNLGDVMKESATIALQWIKAHAERLGIDPERFAKTDVHVHVPEGAVPKDGPSAGITMVTSITGSFTERSVKEGIAMTGEITLRGKVLPVGGIKEKILAAKRAGLYTIVLSSQNRKDIEEIKEEYRSGLEFHYVDTVEEVLDFALEKKQ